MLSSGLHRHYTKVVQTDIQAKHTHIKRRRVGGKPWAGEKAQWLTLCATESKDLRLSTWIHMVEELASESCPLTYKHTH